MLESRPEGLEKYERRVYSQHGEDGILEWLIPRTEHKSIVEIGCGIGNECQATNLTEHHGFEALLLDRRRGSFITAENVNDFIDRPIGVLSIDIDGNDYWIWKALVVEPDIVCIEYNGWLSGSVTIPYRPNFMWRGCGEGNWYHGASLEALYKLGRRRGYQLLGCESSGTNCFFIKRKLGRDLPDLLPKQAFVTRRKHCFGPVDPTLLVKV